MCIYNLRSHFRCHIKDSIGITYDQFVEKHGIAPEKEDVVEQDGNGKEKASQND